MRSHCQLHLSFTQNIVKSKMFTGRLSLQLGSSPRPGPHKCRSSATSGSQTAGQSMNPWAKAAVTSCTFSLLGDLLAQLLPQRHQLKQGVGTANLDWKRLLRMGGFGFFFYGPYQYKWYGALDKQWPSSGLSNFLTKVVLNQIALSPVVLVAVFSWNLGLTGQSRNIQRKLKDDLVPTMINGWKFWVPAASVNFALIPLHSQVLYMSVCSVLWTAYLSHASNRKPQLS